MFLKNNNAEKIIEVILCLNNLPQLEISDEIEDASIWTIADDLYALEIASISLQIATTSQNDAQKTANTFINFGFRKTHKNKPSAYKHAI